MRGTAANLHSSGIDSGETICVVRRGANCLGQVSPNLAFGDIERGDELDISDMVAAEIEMHDARNRKGAGRVAIKFNALYQRRGTVADPDQRDPYFRQNNLRGTRFSLVEVPFSRT